MKTYLLFVGLFLSVISSAQTKTTKEARVIAVVINNTITALEHFENYRNNEKALIKKYPKAKFFMGLLKGKYTIEKGILVLKNEATITLFTEKQIFNNGKLFEDKKLIQGAQIKIGKTKAKIIATKKGELIIKTNN